MNDTSTTVIERRERYDAAALRVERVDSPASRVELRDAIADLDAHNENEGSR